MKNVRSAIKHSMLEEIKWLKHEERFVKNARNIIQTFANTCGVSKPHVCDLSTSILDQLEEIAQKIANCEKRRTQESKSLTKELNACLEELKASSLSSFRSLTVDAEADDASLNNFFSDKDLFIQRIISFKKPLGDLVGILEKSFMEHALVSRSKRLSELANFISDDSNFTRELFIRLSRSAKKKLATQMAKCGVNFRKGIILADTNFYISLWKTYGDVVSDFIIDFGYENRILNPIRNEFLPYVKSTTERNFWNRIEHQSSTDNKVSVKPAIIQDLLSTLRSVGIPKDEDHFSHPKKGDVHLLNYGWMRGLEKKPSVIITDDQEVRRIIGVLASGEYYDPIPIVALSFDDIYLGFS